MITNLSNLTNLLKHMIAENTSDPILSDSTLDAPTPEQLELTLGDDAFVPVPVDNSPNHKALVAAISQRTAEILGPAGVPADLVADFGVALAEEVDNMLRKFARGQQKHGGDIRERDLSAELLMEVQDALIYLICMRLQRAFIKFNI